MEAIVRRFIELDEDGSGRIVEERHFPATPEEIMGIVSSKSSEITATLTGIIPNGVLLVEAQDRGTRYVQRSWGFVMRLPFLRLYTPFVSYRRGTGDSAQMVLIPQPEKVDMAGTPMPGAEKMTFDWYPPKDFAILLARVAGNTFAALIHRSTLVTYRLPLGNCFSDGRMCMGHLDLSSEKSVYDNVQAVVRSFLGVEWTQDLAANDTAALAELFAFGVTEPHPQLPPQMDAAEIVRLLGLPRDANGWGAKIALPTEVLAATRYINWAAED